MENHKKPALAQMAFQMLEAGKDRREVKRCITAHRVKARQAVVLLCKQEMAILKTKHLISGSSI